METKSLKLSLHDYCKHMKIRPPEEGDFPESHDSLNRHGYTLSETMVCSEAFAYARFVTVEDWCRGLEFRVTEYLSPVAEHFEECRASSGVSNAACFECGTWIPPKSVFKALKG